MKAILLGNVKKYLYSWPKEGMQRELKYFWKIIIMNNIYLNLCYSFKVAIRKLHTFKHIYQYQ